MGVKGWLGKDPKVRHPEWRGCRDGQVWSMFLDLPEAKATAETQEAWQRPGHEITHAQ